MLGIKFRKKFKLDCCESVTVQYRPCAHQYVFLHGTRILLKVKVKLRFSMPSTGIAEIEQE